MKLQRGDYADFGSWTFGTVFDVLADGRVCACTNHSAGRIIIIPRSQAERATLLARGNQSVKLSVDRSVTPG